MTEFFSKIKNSEKPFWQRNTEEQKEISDSKKATTPLIFKPEETAKPKDIKTDSNSLFKYDAKEFGFSVNKYIKSDDEAVNQKDGLAKEMPGWYVLKDDEARSEQLNNHLSKFKNEKEQLAEIKRLIQTGVSKSDFEILAKTHKALKDNNVTAAMKDILNVEGDENKKTRAGLAVVNEIKNMKAKHQAPVSREVIATGNKTVITAGSKQVAKLDKSAQVEVHAMYFDLNDKAIQTNLAEQYGEYDKSCEIDIHKKMMTSEYQEVLNTAASYIWKLDESNQKEAVRITALTNNEEAIKCAAEQISRYAKENQAEIKKTLEETGYESVRETIKKAEAEAKQRAEKENERKTEENKTEKKPESIAQKVKDAISNPVGGQEKVKELLKNATCAERKAILASLSPSQRAKAILSIMGSVPTLEFIDEINQLSQMGNFDDKAKKNFAEKMDNAYAASKISLFDSSLQSAIVNEFAQRGNLNSINKENLSGNAKEIFIKLVRDERDEKR